MFRNFLTGDISDESIQPVGHHFFERMRHICCQKTNWSIDRTADSPIDQLTPGPLNYGIFDTQTHSTHRPCNIIILSWPTVESDLDECLFLGWIVQFNPSVDVILLQTNVLDPRPDVHKGLGGWKHVERDRKRSTVVDVIHPEASASKLPLHITLFLKSNEQPMRRLTTMTTTKLTMIMNTITTTITMMTTTMMIMITTTTTTETTQWRIRVIRRWLRW